MFRVFILPAPAGAGQGRCFTAAAGAVSQLIRVLPCEPCLLRPILSSPNPAHPPPRRCAGWSRDRKSVVSGKSVSVRVDLGGVRGTQKKIICKHTLTSYN